MASLSYIPVPIALNNYLGSYKPTAIDVYLYLAINADREPGPNYGVCITSINRIKADLHLSCPTIRKAISELIEGHYLSILSRNRKIAPPLIQLIGSSGKTRKKLLYIKLLSNRDIILPPVNMMPLCSPSRAHTRSDIEQLSLIQSEVNIKIDTLIDAVKSKIEISSLFGKNIS